MMLVKNGYRFLVFAMVLIMGSLASPDVEAKLYPPGTPARAIQDLDQTLDGYKVLPKTPEDIKFNDVLKKKVLHGTFDVKRLCRLALADHWSEIGSSKQEKFVDVMTQLLEKKAIFSREQGGKKSKGKTPYRVVNKGHSYKNAAKDKALVMSYVHIPTESLKIELNYKMVKEADGQWKIYDVIVDDASLLDNYRYQFNSIIRKDGFDDLLRRMEVKLKELIKDHAKKVGATPAE
jgi:phospholipid transport system substrate-binding protein